MSRREMDLIKKYDTPETVCIVTSYPDKHGESAERNAIANYSRELVREMVKQAPVVVVAEIITTPEVYEEGGILVVRAFDRDNIRMSLQIVAAIKQFKAVQNVLFQIEFGVYGGSATTFSLATLGSLVRMLGKRFTVMVHQVTDDLGELSEHLGIAPRGLKTFIYNIGMRAFYVISGLGSDRVLVHNEYLAQKIKKYVRATKVGVVPHGVGMSRIRISKKQARMSLGWGKRDFVVISFGYLSWYKGSDWIVKAIARFKKMYPHKRIKLILAGGESGTLKNMPHYHSYVTELYRIAKKHNVDITGYVNDMDKEKYFVGSDLVVLPHRVAMSESGVMAHVAMYGKPFIASLPRTTSLYNTSLIQEVGFTWSQKNFENKLMSMFANEKLRSRVGREIKKQGREQSWENVAQKYLVALPNAGNERYTGAKYDPQVAI